MLRASYIALRTQHTSQPFPYKCHVNLRSQRTAKIRIQSFLVFFDLRHSTLYINIYILYQHSYKYKCVYTCIYIYWVWFFPGFLGCPFFATMTKQRGKSSSNITYARMSSMQMMLFLSMAYCGRRRYERRVKNVKDKNEDDDFVERMRLLCAGNSCLHNKLCLLINGS